MFHNFFGEQLYKPIKIKIKTEILKHSNNKILLNNE